MVYREKFFAEAGLQEKLSEQNPQDTAEGHLDKSFENFSIIDVPLEINEGGQLTSQSIEIFYEGKYYTLQITVDKTLDNLSRPMENWKIEVTGDGQTTYLTVSIGTDEYGLTSQIQIIKYFMDGQPDPHKAPGLGRNLVEKAFLFLQEQANRRNQEIYDVIYAKPEISATPLSADRWFDIFDQFLIENGYEHDHSDKRTYTKLYKPTV